MSRGRCGGEQVLRLEGAGHGERGRGDHQIVRDRSAIGPGDKSQQRARGGRLWRREAQPIASRREDNAARAGKDKSANTVLNARRNVDGYLIGRPNVRCGHRGRRIHGDKARSGPAAGAAPAGEAVARRGRLKHGNQGSRGEVRAAGRIASQRDAAAIGRVHLRGEQVFRAEGSGDVDVGRSHGNRVAERAAVRPGEEYGDRPDTRRLLRGGGKRIAAWGNVDGLGAGVRRPIEGELNARRDIDGYVQRRYYAQSPGIVQVQAGAIGMAAKENDLLLARIIGQLARRRPARRRIGRQRRLSPSDSVPFPGVCKIVSVRVKAAEEHHLLMGRIVRHSRTEAQRRTGCGVLLRPVVPIPAPGVPQFPVNAGGKLIVSSAVQDRLLRRGVVSHYGIISRDRTVCGQLLGPNGAVPDPGVAQIVLASTVAAKQDHLLVKGVVSHGGVVARGRLCRR